MIEIKFFASFRERLDCESLQYTLTNEETVGEVLRALSTKSEQWRFLNEQDVLIAVNQTLCTKEQKIKSNDEVAFFPPVTGG